jgi:MarR family 2-MHQ and catechol resistance regulon transcriptional repressor
MGRPTQRARKLKAFRVYLDLLDTADEVRRQLGAQMATFGLTLEEFRLLELLYRKGPVTTSAVMERKVCSRQNVARMARALNERGLVERKVIELPTGDDSEPANPGRRVSEMRLTAAGENFVGKVLPRHMKMVLAVLRTLDWHEQETLGRICEKLRDWDAAKLLQEFGMGGCGGELGRECAVEGGAESLVGTEVRRAMRLLQRVERICMASRLAASSVNRGQPSRGRALVDKWLD